MSQLGNVVSGGGDPSSLIKKSLIALGITASTSLVSYLAYKYFHRSSSSSEELTSSSSATSKSSGSGVGGKSTFKKPIKIYKINSVASDDDDKAIENDWLLFKNEKLGLSFKYPPNYSAILNNSTHLNQIQLIDNNNPDSSVLILISIEENIMNFDSIEYSQQNLELLSQQSIGSINILQQEEFLLSNGLPGIEMTFDIYSDNTIKAYIASISQEFKCYMVQHLVSLGSECTIYDFNIKLIRNLLKTLKIYKPTINGSAILKKNEIEMTLPNLFYLNNLQNNLFSIVRVHKDLIVKEIKLLNLGSKLYEFQKEHSIIQNTNLPLTICGQLCEFNVQYKIDNFEYFDLVFKYLNNYYVLNCKCKSELFNDDFKLECISAAKSLKINSSKTSSPTSSSTSINSNSSLLLSGEYICYENSEFNFTICVPSNQIIHQFSHQEPIVSFVTNNHQVSSNNNNNNKLTIETMVSVQYNDDSSSSTTTTTTIQDVKETALQLLRSSSTTLQIIDSYIHRHENSQLECFTSLYSTGGSNHVGNLNSDSDPSLTFMVSSLLSSDGRMVYTISSYTTVSMFNGRVEELFKNIHQSFSLIQQQ